MDYAHLFKTLSEQPIIGGYVVTPLTLAITHTRNHSQSKRIRGIILAKQELNPNSKISRGKKHLLTDSIIIQFLRNFVLGRSIDGKKKKCDEK